MASDLNNNLRIGGSDNLVAGAAIDISGLAARVKPAKKWTTKLAEGAYAVGCVALKVITGLVAISAAAVIIGAAAALLGYITIQLSPIILAVAIAVSVIALGIIIGIAIRNRSKAKMTQAPALPGLPFQQPQQPGDFAVPSPFPSVTTVAPVAAAEALGIQQLESARVEAEAESKRQSQVKAEIQMVEDLLKQLDSPAIDSAEINQRLGSILDSLNVLKNTGQPEVQQRITDPIRDLEEWVKLKKSLEERIQEGNRLLDGASNKSSEDFYLDIMEVKNEILSSINQDLEGPVGKLFPHLSLLTNFRELTRRIPQEIRSYVDCQCVEGGKLLSTVTSSNRAQLDSIFAEVEKRIQSVERLLPSSSSAMAQELKRLKGAQSHAEGTIESVKTLLKELNTHPLSESTITGNLEEIQKELGLLSAIEDASYPLKDVYQQQILQIKQALNTWKADLTNLKECFSIFTEMETNQSALLAPGLRRPRFKVLVAAQNQLVKRLDSLQFNNGEYSKLVSERRDQRQQSFDKSCAVITDQLQKLDNQNKEALWSELAAYTKDTTDTGKHREDTTANIAFRIAQIQFGLKKLADYNSQQEVPDTAKSAEKESVDAAQKYLDGHLSSLHFDPSHNELSRMQELFGLSRGKKDSLSSMRSESRARKIKSILSKAMAASFLDQSSAKAKEALTNVLGANSECIGGRIRQTRKALSDLQTQSPGIWRLLIEDSKFQQLLDLFNTRNKESFEQCSKEAILLIQRSETILRGRGQKDLENLLPQVLAEVVSSYDKPTYRDLDPVCKELFSLLDKISRLGLGEDFRERLTPNQFNVIKNAFTTLYQLENEQRMTDLENDILLARKTEGSHVPTIAEVAKTEMEKQQKGRIEASKVLAEFITSEMTWVSRLEVLPTLLAQENILKLLQDHLGGNLDSQRLEFNRIVEELREIVTAGHQFIDVLFQTICGRLRPTGNLRDEIQTRLENNQLDFLELTKIFNSEQYYRFANLMAAFATKLDSHCSFMENIGIDRLLLVDEAQLKSLNEGERKTIANLQNQLNNANVSGQKFKSIVVNTAQRGGRWELLMRDLCRHLPKIGHPDIPLIQPVLETVSAFGVKISNRLRFLHEFDPQQGPQ